MPEGVNISIKPSQFTVKPDGTYRSNITVETDSDVPGVHDGDSMSWETIVLLAQARVNGKAIIKGEKCSKNHFDIECTTNYTCWTVKEEALIDEIENLINKNYNKIITKNKNSRKQK